MPRLPSLLAAFAACGSLALVGAFAGRLGAAAPPADDYPADVRYVVFHHPGPAWQRGVDLREQPGIGLHVAHYRELWRQRRLAMGGPFLLPDAGGMMVAAPGVGEDELRDFAAADPAVRSGLLTFEIRPWLVAMQAESPRSPEENPTAGQTPK